MDFARLMVKLFPETKFPNCVFFKYGSSYYQILSVSGREVGYRAESGTTYNLMAGEDMGRDNHTVRSVRFEGSRLLNNRRLVIHLRY